MLKVTRLLDFGEALRELKRGEHVARAGWNGKNMHLYLESLSSPVVFMRRLEPCIVMFTADEKYQPGWLASQADMLAEDWIVVDPLKRKRPRVRRRSQK